jgi:hypothetical protein
MDLNDDYDDDDGFKSIDELLPVTFEEIDRRFQQQCREWPLVKRNQAITARNRAMKQISEMLETPYTEMPLEKPEAA